LPSPRMWLVADTMAEGAGLGAELPAGVVEHERNYPEHRFVATLTLAPTNATRAAGTAHTLTITARDADGGAVTGVEVHFAVLGPANTRAPQVVKTNAAGVAQFTFTGGNPGRD